LRVASQLQFGSVLYRVTQLCVNLQSSLYGRFSVHCRIFVRGKKTMTLSFGCRLLGRPERSFQADLRFTANVLKYFLPRDLQALSADRRETLPRDQKLLQYYNVGPNIFGALSPQKWKPKTCKIRVDFRQLQTPIANIPGTDGDIKNRKTMCRQQFLSRSGCWSLKFFTHVRKWQRFVNSHTSLETGVPQQFQTIKIKKLAYNSIY